VKRADLSWPPAQAQDEEAILIVTRSKLASFGAKDQIWFVWDGNKNWADASPQLTACKWHYNLVCVVMRANLVASTSTRWGNNIECHTFWISARGKQRAMLGIVHQAFLRQHWTINTAGFLSCHPTHPADTDTAVNPHGIRGQTSHTSVICTWLLEISFASLT